MNTHSLARFLPALAAALLVAAPAPSFADHKIKVYRDDDGDGHYVKKTIKTGGNHHSSSRSYCAPHSYSDSRPYYYSPYGSSHYGSTSYYRPRTSIGFSLSTGYSSAYGSSRYYPSSGSSRYAPRSNYSDDLAVDVQRALRRNGYYDGDIDGDIGPESRAAIRDYQRDRGLPTTGRIDNSLLRSLRIG